MNIRRAFERCASRSRSTCATYRRKIGDRYASTTVVSPRRQLISGETSWLTDTWPKPSSRASAAMRCSCSDSGSVHEHDRHGVDAVRFGRLEVGAHRGQIGAPSRPCRRQHALVDFGDALVQQFRLTICLRISSAAPVADLSASRKPW